MIYCHKGYPKSIVRTLKGLCTSQKYLSELRQVAQDCEELVDSFSDKGWTMTVTANVSFGSKMIMLDCHVDSMDDVALILRKLGKYGYSQTQKMEESPESQTRVYRLDKIKLEVAFKGTVCKYVEIGAKMVEEKIYELRCGEDDKDEAA